MTESSDSQMTGFQVVSTKILFEHPWVRIVQDTLEHGGFSQEYIYLESPAEAVGTVGVTQDTQIILTHQYRHPVRVEIYDLPGGRINTGEQPVDAARREFEEETGFFPKCIEPLGYYNQFPGSLKAATHLFFAHDLVATRQNLDESEFLDIVFKPVNEVLDMILDGEVIDGSLQLGVLLAIQKGLLASV
jgi:ADP-ribose pyrophosphatase